MRLLPESFSDLTVLLLMFIAISFNFSLTAKIPTQLVVLKATIEVQIFYLPAFKASIFYFRFGVEKIHERTIKSRARASLGTSLVET